MLGNTSSQREWSGMNGLTTEVVESLSMDVFKKCVDEALRDMV